MRDPPGKWVGRLHSNKCLGWFQKWQTGWRNEDWQRHRNLYHTNFRPVPRKVNISQRPGILGISCVYAHGHLCTQVPTDAHVCTCVYICMFAKRTDPAKLSLLGQSDLMTKACSQGRVVQNEQFKGCPQIWNCRNKTITRRLYSKCQFASSTPVAPGPTHWHCTIATESRWVHVEFLPGPQSLNNRGNSPHIPKKTLKKLKNFSIGLVSMRDILCLPTGMATSQSCIYECGYLEKHSPCRWINWKS